ncbi:MAG: hypothetical protein RR277_06250 [Rikenellaceae bacterium]
MSHPIKYNVIKLLHESKLYMAYYVDNVDFDFTTLQLSAADKLKADSLHGKKRKMEFLTVRAMLSEILPSQRIVYSATGAPIIESDACHISISHCDSCVGILVSGYECGLDIENTSRDFLSAAKRFITENDTLIRSDMDLAAAWVTKEAIYKAHKGVDINIFTDIVITHMGEKQIACSVMGKTVISRILIIDSLIISYVNLLNVK